MRAGLLAAVLLAACAKRRAGEIDSATMAATLAAAEAGQKMRAAQEAGEAACAPLETAAVPWREEDFIGTQFALSDASAGGGLYVDAPDKNAVTEYVQRVGQLLATASARPSIPWTFGVIDDPQPRATSEMGGWVFVTTGLLAKLSNEAELAAALAHEIAHVSAKHPVATYTKTRTSACRTSLVGVNLVEAGAADTPGGQDFVASSNFAKTMRKFATPAYDFFADPEVDNAFIRWLLGQQRMMQQMLSTSIEPELEADRAAVELLAASGYEPKGLAKVAALVDPRNAAARAQALETLEKEGGFGFDAGGKAPAFPKALAWPKL